MTGAPRPVQNRHGLPRIDTRVGRHADFLADLVGGLDDSARSRLAQLGTRDARDPSIAVLDAWAAVCDILSFYSERHANEAYVGTATDRMSLVELSRLVGYRPAPGAAAEALLAFSLDRPADVVLPTGTDPGTEPHVLPVETIVPERLRVRSVPDAGQRPHVFETVEDLRGRAEWNVLPVWSWRRHFARPDSVELYVHGVALGLTRGQPFMLLEGAGFGVGEERVQWWLRTIGTVEDASGDRTRITLEIGADVRELDLLTPPHPATFAFSKRLTLFGANAPAEGTVPEMAGPESTPNAVVFESVFQGAGYATVDVAGSHPDILPGSLVFLSSRFVKDRDKEVVSHGLYEVREISELARADYGVSGPVTRIVVHGTERPFGNPRQVTVFAVPIPLEVVDAPDDSVLEQPASLMVEGDASAMPSGRRLIVTGISADASAGGLERTESAVLDEAAPAEPTDRGMPRTELRLKRNLKGRYVRATTRVYGNVVPATHGETVEQLLADPSAPDAGSDRTPVYPLANGPLTYVSAANENGIASTLEVTEDGVAWHERRSLHGAAEGERVFVVRTEPDGSMVVALQRRPQSPGGSRRLRARYRVGIGAEGEVDAARITALVDRPLGVRAVTNPLPAGGGADPATPDELRARLPLQTRTLGRVVSLTDYADFALAFAGVSDAVADALPLRTGRAVVVSACGPGGEPLDPTTSERLRASLEKLGDPAASVLIESARIRRFRLRLGVAPDSDREPDAVREAVGARLRAVLSPKARRLGQSLHASEVVAEAAAVPGVRGIDFDGFSTVDGIVRRIDARRAVAPDPDHVEGAELLILDEVDPFERLDVTT